LAGGVVSVAAGSGVVLWVVVASVESLHAAAPESATAETVAKMSFFIICLLQKDAIGRHGARQVNAGVGRRFRNFT